MSFPPPGLPRAPLAPQGVVPQAQGVGVMPQAVGIVPQAQGVGVVPQVVGAPIQARRERERWFPFTKFVQILGCECFFFLKIEF